MVKLSKLWENLHASLWCLPTLIIAGAVALAVGLIELDERVGPRAFESWPRVFGADADGARSTLSAIATAVMTVAGVTFSITVVALSLAASQYSSRVLRTFLRDRADQTVLGVLLGVFGYCLVVLQSVRGGPAGGPAGGFVPQVAFLTAVVLAFVAVGFLIFFIHHIATSIQVSHILAAVGEEAAEAVDLLFPQELGETDEETDDARYGDLVAAQTWHPVPAHQTGYIQRVDADAMLEFAKRHGVIVRMEQAIGEFVAEGTTLVSVADTGRPDAEAMRRLNEVFAVGRYRTVEQDAGFAIRQIVDMALKALSPGVNDSTTAVMAVEYLTAILVRLAGRRIESPHRVDGGELRVVTRGSTFESLLNLSFDQIRQNASGNVAVLTQLFGALEAVAGVARTPRRRQSLRAHAEAVAEVARRTVTAPRERARLDELGTRLTRRLTPGGD